MMYDELVSTTTLSTNQDANEDPDAVFKRLLAEVTSKKTLFEFRFAYVAFVKEVDSKCDVLAAPKYLRETMQPVAKTYCDIVAMTARRPHLEEDFFLFLDNLFGNTTFGKTNGMLGRLLRGSFAQAIA